MPHVRSLHPLAVGAPRLAVLGLLATWTALGQQVPNTKPIKPCVAWGGARSAIIEPTYVRITSMPEWTRLWARHLGKPVQPIRLGRPPGSDDQFIPEVNFDEYMLVAIFKGRSVNSDGIQLVSIIDEADRILVRFDDWSYQTAGPDGGADTVSPYGLYLVPRSPKPVVFEENVQGLKNQPPQWKVRARVAGPSS